MLGWRAEEKAGKPDLNPPHDQDPPTPGLETLKRPKQGSVGGGTAFSKARSLPCASHASSEEKTGRRQHLEKN